MRVISGKARGTKLYPPINNNIRPTTDRIKETLFNMINFYIDDSNVLDLYSGSGAIGIEFLSRGANNCTFVEKDKEHYQLIESNLNKTTLDGFLINGDVLNIIPSLDSKYDIIFMDAPYNKDFENKTIELILKNNILKNNSILIIEHSSKTVIKSFDNLEILKNKKFKTTEITILKLQEVL